MTTTYIWVNFVIFICGYLIGSINMEIIVSKRLGKDIRTVGSKNAGATNFLRAFGLKVTVPVFLFDVLKCLIPVLIVFFTKIYLPDKDETKVIIPLVAAFGVMLGHVFPVFFKFKGGKGVATFFGAALAFHVEIFTLFLMIFIFFILVSRYVSVASTLSVFGASSLAALPIWHEPGHILNYMNQAVPMMANTICLALGAMLIILKHIPNFIRLASKTEPRICFYKERVCTPTNA
ncbi:glycerol-3-phosphate acyltransferase PlsY [Metamycoplasma subdolum]|uniref:Glycerol-3-phosphate acyltransferase n=1 Tax=Metamycoplasma subdolum TaxID=92407 RepID=A0A3M0A1I5_9BACT|nr:glycerol-3-phosphate 1-O-acyltransferase PlsY [Metamycoplasma subdolum]RMA78486.1 glycerol-3-phosphate acyltransferase PlsY [Metamycoplasma subdolum]WPB50418.1 glycerol-3-phosphate 1-O-acyltransferase PlsY [Metamycoplasma subdolum]